MLYALDKNGLKILAERGVEGRCPTCKEKLIAKCGRIMAHHWAHPGEDCDPWHEPETDWHRYWKSLVPSECVEFTFEKNGKQHRADIITREGKVIELQHSSIIVDDIEEREKFYGEDMIWLFDARECCAEPQYHDTGFGGKILTNPNEFRLRLQPKNNYHLFRWYHPRKSIAYAKAKRYLDVGRDQILRLDEMSVQKKCFGKGLLKPKSTFEDWLKKQCAAQ